jgi:hypothetical protein
MRQFTIAVAIIASAALISAAPASAENIGGGPLQQNGKCWHGRHHSSASEATFGYWESCAEKASISGRRGRGAAPQATTRPVARIGAGGPY